MSFLKMRRSLLAVLVLAGVALPAVALAANTPNLTQTVNQGTLTTDILQSDDTTAVSSPAVNFPALNESFNCQTNTAALGDTNNRVYVTNLATNNGWTLAMAATGGSTATWTAGANHYAFNDATGSGCTNGQLTVNPSAATVTLNCNSVCNSTGVTTGSSTAYVAGTADNVTLMQDSNGNAWRGYLTGIGLSQKVPGGQAAGSYALGMTITVTAN